MNDRDGTIASALSREDGTHVYLDAVLVDKIKAMESPYYFVIRESWDFSSRIVVAVRPPLAIRPGQTVDVEGDVVTLPNGHRAIYNATIFGYLDQNGNLLRFWPFMKGYLEPAAWPYGKTELSFDAAGPQSARKAQSAFSRVMDYPLGPDPNAEPLPPATYYETITALLADDPENGAIVGLQCKQITSTSTGSFVMTDDGGSDTLSAYCAGTNSADDRVNDVTGTLQTENGVRVLDVDSGPGFDEQGYVGSATLTQQETISWVKTFADATPLEIGESQPASVTGIVSAIFPVVGCFYMQTSLRTAGVRINFNLSPMFLGHSVNVVGGSVTTTYGERCINNPLSVTDTTPASVVDVQPIGMSNKLLGGGAANIYTPAAVDGHGVCNQGILVRTWGRVTALGSGCFYITDGSTDGSGAGADLKVSTAWADPQVALPNVGSLLQLTGISAAEGQSTPYTRVMRVRKPEDVVALTPTIAITSPPAGTLHAAANPITIHISGTATTGLTGITSVSCKVVQGQTETTLTVSGTTSWSCDWPNASPGSYTICASVADSQGFVATASSAVTVVALSGTIIHVSCQRPDDSGDGFTWATAKKSVIAGRNAVSAGGELWVAAGTYKEASTISLKSGVAFYGGFAGNEAAREQRNWAVNETVLDGSGIRTVVSAFGLSSGTLDGFAIINGQGDLMVGAGIDCQTSTCTISHNTIRSCTGAGIYLDAGSVVVADNIVSDNRPDTNYTLCDGGIYFNSGGSSNEIVNNTVVGNVSLCGGGGVYIAAGSPVITNNVFAYNSGVGVHEVSVGPNLHTNDVYGNVSGEYVGLTKPATDVSVDPLFVLKETGDFRIRSTSPCINAGTSITGKPDLDIGGQTRVYPTGGVPDIGADEWDGFDPLPALPTVIYVKPAGGDGNDGSSWTSAKKTIQAGIGAACAEHKDVWVAAGVYNESLTIASRARVMGGFAGSEVDVSQRDWGANRTVIDATGTSGSAVAFDYATLAAVDGFTIRGGNGGGVTCDFSVCTVSHNEIRNCSGLEGGGIASTNSAVTIDDNLIVDNQASDNGGGIYFSGDSSVTASKIVNNTIACNTADSGGGIYLASGSTICANNIIATNTGGGVCGAGGSHTLQYNDVWQNTAYPYSGISAGTGSISDDPLFLGGGTGDFHITSGSHCINAGSDSLIQSNVDIDGGARKNGAVDMGADEWNGSNPPQVNPTVLYVKTTGSDNNDGSTWLLAKGTIQAGLDAAGARGGEVWVAAGTYLETISTPSFVGLYGGFAGTETNRSQRNWTSNHTCIDATGKPNKSVVTMDGSYYTCVDGFGIQNASLNAQVQVLGGGMYVRGGQPTISHNTITANTASQGGGIYCTSPAIITDNTITNNAAQTWDHYGEGGGICCLASSPLIQGNIIQSNTAVKDGAGIYCYSSSPQIVQNTIQSNTASIEGGGLMCNSSSPTVEANIFDSNFGADHAGAIAMHSCTGVRIANNVFRRNHTQGNFSSGKGGGAIHAYLSGPVIVNNTFIENYVGTGTWPNITPFTYGGAIHVRGAATPSTKIINNIFLNNRAAAGFIQSNSVAFTDSGTGSITYCDAFSTNHGETAYHYYDQAGVVTPGGGCVAPGVDPCLCSVTAARYWLTTTPLHGQNHASDANVPAADIDGYSRPGQDGYTDMGAYESDGRSCPP